MWWCVFVFELSGALVLFDFGVSLFIDRTKLHEIADLVSDILESQGYTCIDAEWEAHARILRLYIDHPNGIDLDQCALVSNQLVESPRLDTILPVEYNLEISSPGIERPIRTLDHFKSAQVQRESIDVKLTEKYQNRRKGIGQIVDISPDSMISLKTTEGPWTFPWNLVLKATKVVDWNKIQQRQSEH
jgi:ribosome maturation factor RimP